MSMDGDAVSSVSSVDWNSGTSVDLFSVILSELDWTFGVTKSHRVRTSIVPRGEDRGLVRRTFNASEHASKQIKYSDSNSDVRAGF